MATMRPMPVMIPVNMQLFSQGFRPTLTRREQRLAIAPEKAGLQAFFSRSR
jgi:hypothetical protein